MIIRERADEWVMIEQHDHAEIAGEMARKLKACFLQADDKRSSVELAIREHDRGWLPFDQHPIINDVMKTPYSFLDFPLPYKSILYKQGIDEVETLNPYAGLLCSYHYEQFMIKHEADPYVAAFLQSEKERQARLISKFSSIPMDVILHHFALLRFCDNLSLYVCLNEPGVSKELEHPFFRHGIDAPCQEAERIQLSWFDSCTIQLEPFPFKEEWTVILIQKVVPKAMIENVGIAKAYALAPRQRIDIRMTRKT